MTVMNIMPLLLARPAKRDTFRNLYITKFSVIYFTITTVIVKYMKKKLDLTKPRYSKQILLVPWPFVFSRFHCILLLLGGGGGGGGGGGKENRLLYRDDFLI